MCMFASFPFSYSLCNVTCPAIVFLERSNWVTVCALTKPTRRKKPQQFANLM
uniref:Uncharacterized protein n=1 Tax=Anguilla anguilla TaxID=7936 RepID=A0A0E9UFC9_ANGAN